MSANKLDAWLDALAEKQNKLEQELTSLNAGQGSLEKQLQGQASREEAQRLVQGNAGLAAHLKKQEAEADAAGRGRADASARELDELRGKQPPQAGRGRPGAVRV
jgi:preprotein translocase subunit SecD